MRPLFVLLCASSLVAAEPLRLDDVPGGTLFVCGGGKLPGRVFDEFVKAAGGEKARIVVVPTASEDAEAYLAGSATGGALLERWRSRGVADVAFFHARSRDEANDPKFIKPLIDATGVWFEEGFQSRLAERYVDTKVHAALRALLARGGVIGGTSAGAAIMSDPMIAGDDPSEPGKPLIVRGFGLLPGAIVDQHFLVRNRQRRLNAALVESPNLVGLGIDEGTCLVVRGRSLSVVGESSVIAQLDPTGKRPLTFRLSDGAHDDLIALSRAVRDRRADPFPPSQPSAPKVENGSLVIVGGGRLPDDVKKKFIELAGGPKGKIVVVPAASDRPQSSGEVKWLKETGAENVVLLNPRDRKEADDPQFAETLNDATGVWFGGGRQWRTVDAFERTACYVAFHDVLKRGGVIGGSSAGATIQGEYLVRGSPVVNTIMMAPGYERGFAFLPGTAIDQHFTQRKRQPDMLLLKQTHPQLLGLGIDEGTAVVVRGTTLSVLGEATVSIYAPYGDPTRPDVLNPGDEHDLGRMQSTPN